MGVRVQRTIAGADLALLDRGGVLAGRAVTSGVQGVSVDGHPVRLFFGCSDGTNASALTEARRLVDDVGVDVLVGPLAGNEGLALQDFARSRPRVAFVDGSASSYQFDPAPNFFTFHTDGAAMDGGARSVRLPRPWLAPRRDDRGGGRRRLRLDAGGGFRRRVLLAGRRRDEADLDPAGDQDFAATSLRSHRAGVDGVVISPARMQRSASRTAIRPAQ